MSDDLDEIKKILKGDLTVKPRSEAKEKAISAAMQAFDELQENTADAHQGSHVGPRPTRKQNGLIETILEGINNMRKNSVIRNSALAGTAFATMVALLLVSQQRASDIKLASCASGDTHCIEAPPLPPIKQETDKSKDQVKPAILSATGAEARQTGERSQEGKAEDTQLVQKAAPANLVPESKPVPGSDPAATSKKDDIVLADRMSPSAPKSEKQAAGEQSIVSGISAHHRTIVPDTFTQPQYRDFGRDKFESVKSNSIKIVKADPLSTLSVDVDTASYSFVRGALNRGVLPQKDSVRIEELVNYFPYEYAGPDSKNEPFRASVSVFPSPWNAGKKIMHVGIRGYKLDQSENPRSNLVFLVDTSGSMNSPDKLPLLVSSLKMLVDTLKPEDTISIVTYAGSAGTVLEPTKANDRGKILSALDRLGAGGSTAGAEGIRQAYQLAEQNFDKNGVNRVILATDGDFNVGITDPNELKSFIERKRETGVFLSVLGFGRGNYNDELMQKLAQNGNGNAAYIDNLSEARKVLVEEAGSTLFTIAKDVKIQIEFNPATVAEYRLIGYETRLLNREDFNNDKIDAGDIGAGHTVTALYEITPVDSNSKLVDDLRYSNEAAEKTVKADTTGEYAFVKIRYKLPTEDTSKLITSPVDNKSEYKQLGDVPTDARFATAVASFGQLLRGDSFTGKFSYDDVINLAGESKGSDKFGYRSEFINLVRLAKSASTMEAQPR